MVVVVGYRVNSVVVVVDGGVFIVVKVGQWWLWYRVTQDLGGGFNVEGYR